MAKIENGLDIYHITQLEIQILKDKKMNLQQL